MRHARGVPIELETKVHTKGLLLVEPSDGPFSSSVSHELKREFLNITPSCPRFNMGDGKFGAAYAQEDGVAFKEESTGNNERIGEQKRMRMIG